MIFETIVVGALEVNCYILSCGQSASAIIIDPGDDAARIKKALASHKLSPGMVINTHGHYDHIGADDAFAVPVYVHSADAGMLRDAKANFSVFCAQPVRITARIEELKDRQRIRLDEIELEVIHVPGHSAGGIALRMIAPDPSMLFTGDALFAGSIGRTDLGGMSSRSLISAIKERLLVLPDDTVVYPGHGQSSTIGEERRNNPFLSPNP
jgi:glyoxylase-like metal-dependent hydrolase (beta-lactamase superfamily II)